MSAAPKRACVEVIMPDHWHSQSCGAKASIEHESKWYCKRHDPQKRAAERARKDKLRQAKSAEADARWNVAQLERKLLDLLCSEGTVLHNVRDSAMDLIESVRSARQRLKVAMSVRKALEKKP
jgi:hypothetical protein